MGGDDILEDAKAMARDALFAALHESDDEDDEGFLSAATDAGRGSTEVSDVDAKVEAAKAQARDALNAALLNMENAPQAVEEEAAPAEEPSPASAHYDVVEEKEARKESS